MRQLRHFFFLAASQGWSSPIAIVEHQMDDVPNQAVPSVIADQGLVRVRKHGWLQSASYVSIGLREPPGAQQQGAPLKPSLLVLPLALTASLFGPRLPGVVQYPTSRADPLTHRGSRSTFRHRKPPRNPAPEGRKAGAMRAAQSLNAEEVSAPEPAKRGTLSRRKDEPGAGIAEAAGNTSPLPPKPVEKLADGGERGRSGGLKIAALLAVDPVVDHSSIRNAGAKKTGTKELATTPSIPSQHPNAPGAPRPLRSFENTHLANWPTNRELWSRVRHAEKTRREARRLEGRRTFYCLAQARPGRRCAPASPASCQNRPKA